MPLKLIAPLEQEFELEVSDRKYGTDGSPTKITVRQATQAQNEKRELIYAEVTQVFAKNGGKTPDVQFKQMWSQERLKRMECFLSMVSCNIEDEDGTGLFIFKKIGDKQYLDMTDIEFEKAWGRLPPDVAQEIHNKVLLVNLQWAGPLEKSL